MLVLLISDVHSNLAALDAVLSAEPAARADEIWHLGDLVGYGPQPLEVIDRLGALGASNVLGNHDAAAAGLIPPRDFNALASTAIAWTAEQLSSAHRDYLAALPRVETSAGVTRVHGSLRDPLWEYLTSVEGAREHFNRQETALSAVGHTHLPMALRFDNGALDARQPEDGERVDLAGGKWCLNPGSVGQPRDSDARASFAILDLNALTATFHRAPYDVGATQRLMREAGLPDPLARRLSFGR